MFTLSPSYGDNWRIFVCTSVSLEIHEIFRTTCMWGGNDKRETKLDGSVMLGYEYPNMEAACKALTRLSNLYR